MCGMMWVGRVSPEGGIWIAGSSNDTTVGGAGVLMAGTRIHLGVLDVAANSFVLLLEPKMKS